jgi:hypothetical protein
MLKRALKKLIRYMGTKLYPQVQPTQQQQAAAARHAEQMARIKRVAPDAVAHDAVKGID